MMRRSTPSQTLDSGPIAFIHTYPKNLYVYTARSRSYIYFYY